MIFAASLLSTQHQDMRTNTGLLKARIMCSEWSNMSTCGLLFSVSQHYRNPTKHVGLLLRRYHQHLIEMQLVLAMIELKNCSVDIKQQSLIHCNQCIYSFCLYNDILCPTDWHFQMVNKHSWFDFIGIIEKRME